MKGEKINLNSKKYEYFYTEDLDDKIGLSEVYVYTSSYVPFHINSSKKKAPSLKKNYNKINEEGYFTDALQLSDYFYSSVLKSFERKVDVYEYKRKDQIEVEIKIDKEKIKDVEQIDSKINSFEFLHIESSGESKEEIYFLHIDVENKILFKEGIENDKKYSFLSDIKDTFSNIYKKYYNKPKDEVIFKEKGKELCIFTNYDKEKVQNYIKSQFEDDNEHLDVGFIFNRKAFNYTTILSKNKMNPTKVEKLPRIKIENYDMITYEYDGKYKNKRKIYHSTYKFIFLIGIIQKTLIWYLHDTIKGLEGSDAGKIDNFIILSENFMFLDVSPEKIGNSLYFAIKEKFGIDKAIQSVENDIAQIMTRQINKKNDEINSSVKSLTYLTIFISIYSFLLSVPALFTTTFDSLLTIDGEVVPKGSNLIIFYGNLSLSRKLTFVLLLTSFIMILLLFIAKILNRLRKKWK